MMLPGCAEKVDNFHLYLMSFVWREIKWIKRVKPYQMGLHLNKPYLKKNHMVYIGREGKRCNKANNH